MVINNDEIHDNMVERKTWDEFRKTKLLWWVNRSLHLFGWSIIVEMRNDDKVLDIYPAKIKYRGFDAKTESEGFDTLTDYLKYNL